jgi:hypothetical protein
MEEGLKGLMLKEATGRRDSAIKVINFLEVGKLDEAYHLLLGVSSDLTNYIILEGERKRPNRSPDHKYPDLLVSIPKLGMDPRIEALGLGVKNTANEGKSGDGAPFIGNIKHKPAQDLVLGLEQRKTLVLPHLYDTDLVYDLLMSQEDPNFVLYRGDGVELDPKIALQILDERFGFDKGKIRFRGPWRGEWLANTFGKNNTSYHVINPSCRNLEYVTRDLDPDTLMEDRRISMLDWAKNPTSNGLPRKGIEKGKLTYCYPRKGAVARFLASSDGAGLGCNGDPEYSYSGLGVRVAKIKE